MRHATSISSATATVLLIIGYGLNARWLALLVSLVLGLLWLFGQRRGWTWTASLGLAGSVGTAALATLSSLSAAWTLPGIIAVLVAWDLDRFAHHLRTMPHVEGVDELRRAHMRRLFLVAGVGALPATVALLVHVQLAFGWIFFLALLAVIGISRAVSALRRASEG